MILTNKIDLKLLRRDIKKIGFNFRVKKYSEFDYIEFYHIGSKKLYPDIFTEVSMQLFQPLINYFKDNNL